jgi:hypothetical protein
MKNPCNTPLLRKSYRTPKQVLRKILERETVGVPLEVVSKVILRHQDLKTTHVYLGKIDDSEAIRWMDILHGK